MHLMGNERGPTEQIVEVHYEELRFYERLVEVTCNDSDISIDKYSIVGSQRVFA